MRLLLDTHIFLWFISADVRLSATAAAAIRDPGNEVYLSTASVWEACIKYRHFRSPRRFTSQPKESGTRFYPWRLTKIRFAFSPGFQPYTGTHLTGY